jgi:hypothetical protein
LLAGILTAPAATFESFEGDGFGEWQSTGSAFGLSPVHGKLDGMKGEPTAYANESFALSAHGGDEAVGTLVSPEFTIKEDYIAFLIAGGDHAGKTALQLIVDGKVAMEANDLYIKNDEFKAFFRQIRYFLTVQEQIDLYQKWCKSGCRSACFLLGISLVASGFARRKPERLVQALKVMNKLDSNELRDIIAYTSLLLGKVEVAKDISFYSEASNQDENKASPETRLAILCSNCREWLEHDVLEGYRDLETDTDLEAYFSDRDVTTFIEGQDSNIITDKSTNKTFLDPRDLSNKLLRRSATDNTSKSNKPTKNNKVTYSNKIRGVNHFIFLRFIDKKWTISILALTLLITIWSFISRGDQTKQKDVTSIGAKRTLPVDMNEHVKGKEKREEISKRLTSKEQVPNKSELENILSEWLNIKTKTLSGLSISKNVSRIATPEAIKRLESERKGDIAKAERQRIIVAIRNLDIIRRERQRIEVKATLSYEDERLNKDGKIIEKTPKHVFKKTYILVNKGTGWLLQ